MRKSVRILSVLVGAMALVLMSSGVAGAHTEAGVVAIPVNERAEITLTIPHGCGAAGTTELSVQIPAEEAEGHELDGWTVTTEAGPNDTNVVVWEGGPLPADEVGEFTVSFIAPNTVGELMFLNSIQVCEDGEQMEWTDVDPLGAYPSARVLILAEGSPVAHSIDDIPEGTPGRELLDGTDHDHSDHDDHGDDHGEEGHDDGAGETTDETTTTTTDPEAEVTATGSASVIDDEDDEAEGSPLLWIILGAVIVGVIGAGAYLASRSQSADGGTDGTDGTDGSAGSDTNNA